MRFLSSVHRVCAAALLSAVALAGATAADAHGSQVKITDDTMHKTYEPQYGEVTVNADGSLTFWGVTVHHGTITYSDGWGNQFNNYQAIPIDRNNAAFRSNEASMHVVNAPPPVTAPAPPPAGTSGTGSTNTSGGTLITNDGGSVISNDGGSIVAAGGGNVVAAGTYNLAATNGKPYVYGQKDARRLSCGLASAVYVPGNGSSYYYDGFAKGVEPRTGFYICRTDAAKLRLADGGFFH